MKGQDEIRDSLRERLERLLARTGKIEADLRKPGDRDWAERAAELENEEVLEQLDEAERQEIAQIRAALGRLEAGTYGMCGSCGGPIGDGRLRALPFATTCIACAE